MTTTATPGSPYHTITEDNVDDYQEFLGELRQHFQEIVRMTTRYPVEVEFKELRFLFIDEKDIQNAITLLTDRIEEFRRERAARAGHHASA